MNLHIYLAPPQIHLNMNAWFYVQNNLGIYYLLQVTTFIVLLRQTW